MALRRKPQTVQSARALTLGRGRRVDALIAKGSSPVGRDPDTRHLVQLRLPRSVLERIDVVRFARGTDDPRHTWLLEAVDEKLAREERRR